jgi:hypothetical protein
MNQIPDYFFLPDNVTGNLILDDKLDFDRYSVNSILKENPRMEIQMAECIRQTIYNQLQRNKIKEELQNYFRSL